MKKTLTLRNQIEDVSLLPDFVDEICEELGLGADKSFNLNLVLEEAVTNVASYAFPQGEKHEFHLYASSDENQLVFMLEDDGKPFDPTTVADVDTTLSAEERQIGGLGIFLIRQIMTDVNYAYVDGKNQLTMTLSLSEETEQQVLQ